MDKKELLLEKITKQYNECLDYYLENYTLDKFLKSYKALYDVTFATSLMDYFKDVAKKYTMKALIDIAERKGTNLFFFLFEAQWKYDETFDFADYDEVSYFLEEVIKKYRQNKWMMP